MFEKLKNLIFEDDPEDYEDEEEEVIPVRKPKEKVQKPVTRVEQEPAKSSMSRIDVTQQIKTPVVPSYNEASAQQESVFKQQPVFEKAEPSIPVKPAPVERPRAASLTVDDFTPAAPVVNKPKKVSNPTVSKPVKKAPVYEFNPVISPIFGVDEKDVDAVQNTGKTQTTRKATSAKKNDEFVSKVISPMYGVNKDDQPSTVQKTVEKSNRMEEMAVSKQKIEAEDTVPEFSLDDILSVRDSIDDIPAVEETAPVQEPVHYEQPVHYEAPVHHEEKYVQNDEEIYHRPVVNTREEKEVVTPAMPITKPLAEPTLPPLPKKKPVFDTATLFDDDDDDE